MLLLDTRLPFGSLIPGCEERLDPAGTGSFYNEGEADIVVDHIRALLATGNLQLTSEVARNIHPWSVPYLTASQRFHLLKSSRNHNQT